MSKKAVSAPLTQEETKKAMSAVAVPKHLSSDYGTPHEVVMDIEVAHTLQELAANPQLAVFKLAPHLNKNWKTNIARKNRSNASGADLRGNNNMGVIVGFKIYEKGNINPVAFGLKSSHLVSRNLSRHDAYVERVPAHFAPQSIPQVGRPIFDPNHIVDEEMAQKLRLLNMQDLKEIVVPREKAGHKYYEIASKSLVHYWIANEIAQYANDPVPDHPWANEFDQFDVQKVADPGLSHTFEVTEKIGKDALAFFEPQVREASSALVNLEDFSFTVERADGHKAFDAPHGLIGEIVGENGKSDTRKINETFLNKRGLVYFKVGVVIHTF